MSFLEFLNQESVLGSGYELKYRLNKKIVISFSQVNQIKSIFLLALHITTKRKRYDIIFTRPFSQCLSSQAKTNNILGILEIF